MKIAVPTMGKNGLEELVAEHFGQALFYIVVDEKGNVLEALENTSAHRGGTGLPPELLHQKGINVLLCHGIGPKALQLCKNLEIQVYVGESSSVKELFAHWKNQELQQAGMQDACKEHR
ncbi:MAG: NifB/NifX family molybdenum-iron cluster-binding protein [Parachlamydiales bacterium]|nr:NifB/NifX family molybdenum-iron cluster-binding protein [Parachlamydiales bacterium]